jgi:hypothetical protein
MCFFYRSAFAISSAPRETLAAGYVEPIRSQTSVSPWSRLQNLLPVRRPGAISLIVSYIVAAYAITSMGLMLGRAVNDDEMQPGA